MAERCALSSHHADGADIAVSEDALQLLQHVAERHVSLCLAAADRQARAAGRRHATRRDVAAAVAMQL